MTTDTFVTFQSKHPHRTLGLHVTYPKDQPPAALLSDLQAAGWELFGFEPPPLNGVASTSLDKPGSGIFQEWTPDERKTFAAEARRILRRHGHASIGHRKLTLADLL